MKLIKNTQSGDTALVLSLDGYESGWEIVLEDVSDADSFEMQWGEEAQAFIPIPDLYANKRRNEYPSFEEFADALYWKEKGDDSKWLAYVTACDVVKEKHPKPDASS